MTSLRTFGVVLTGVTTALLAAACAEPETLAAAGGISVPAPSEEDRNLVEPEYQGRFAVTATVLESPEHGPQLCSAVAESYPPQCGGPDLVGWDWSTVPAESASGTTWGDYRLVGTFDGERFTLTEPATPVDPATAPAEGWEPDFTPPCDEPAGGWQPADPATATDGALQEAFARAATIPAYAGGWLYQVDGDADGVDPRRTVLTLRFTGDDLAEHTRQIREVWGGPLCVAPAQRTEAELYDLQQRASQNLPGLVSSAVDVTRDAVSISLLLATTDQQAALDAEYGEGVVLLYGMLEPID